MPKLNWSIVKHTDGSFVRRAINGSDLEHVDVEWSHADGFPDDTIETPVSLSTAQLVLACLLDVAVAGNVINSEQRSSLELLATDIVNTDRADLVEHGLGLITIKTGNRRTIKDQLSVTSSITDSTIAIMLDGKRRALATSLGVLP